MAIIPAGSGQMPGQIMVRSISDQLYDVLREQILDGSLPAGQPIRQDTLAATFNISKIPLREALARLEHDRLVSASPKRGYAVSDLQPAEATEVFKLRLTLEPDTAAAACLRANDAERREAKAALQRLETALKKQSPDRGRCNRFFHYSLIEPGTGQLTLHLIDTISVIADRYVRLHLHPLGRNERANVEHRAILTAWLDRDQKAVHERLTQHIADTLTDLQAQLQEVSA